MVDPIRISARAGRHHGAVPAAQRGAISDILDTLDALLREKNFYPNSNRYQAELRAARIYVERMDAAMSAVLHKGGRNISLQKYQELHANKLSQLPEDQRRNIADYWKRGPSPGLLNGRPPSIPRSPKRPLRSMSTCSPSVSMT